MDTITISENNETRQTFEDIIQKYPLKKIIDCIISVTTLNSNKSSIEENSELTNFITYFYKEYGAQGLLSYLLNMNSDPTSNNFISENTDSKKESGSSTVDEEIMINDVIHLSDNIEDMEEDIIDLNEDNDEDNYISLVENIPKKEGAKSEVRTKKVHFQKKDIPRIISEEKVVRKKKKKLSYHYSLINGKFYKYKLYEYNGQKGIAKYICFDNGCNGFGVYDTKNKTFTLLRLHENKCLSDKGCDFYDKLSYEYMKMNDLEELQVLNDS